MPWTITALVLIYFNVIRQDFQFLTLVSTGAESKIITMLFQYIS
jgi:hypothetical protein